MELPHFKYHPDPIATGSIKASDIQCSCCGQARGYIYNGPAYGGEDRVCPWCIADGTAYRQSGSTFVDPEGIGGYGYWDAVSEEVIEEVAHRTPGFAGCQQEQWWTHCGGAAEFLGPAGYKELEQHGEEAVTYIRELFGENTNIQGQELDNWIKRFHRIDSPTAYLFRCRHCRKLGGYWDAD